VSLAALLASRAKSRIEYGGAEVAESYGDVDLEWAAIDGRTGLVDTSFRRTIVVSGSERRDYLHGQLSQSLVTLKPGDGAPALLLNPQGRLISTVAIYDEGEAFEIAVEESNLEATLARLEQYCVADDVEFLVDDPRERFALVGPDAMRFLVDAGAEVPDDAETTGAWFMRRAQIAEVDVLLYGRGDLRLPYVDVVSFGDGARVWKALEAAGARPAGAKAFEIIRVESGTPRYGVDVSDAEVALEARLEWAIHFRKGCYVGQEIIERAVSRGRVNRLLTLLAVAEPVEAGDLIGGTGARERVTSCVESPRSGVMCLGYVMRELAEVGKKLVIERGDRDVPAEVLPWPRPDVLPGR
jgi:folate-binding protein YgfZ